MVLSFFRPPPFNRPCSGSFLRVQCLLLREEEEEVEKKEPAIPACAAACGTCGDPCVPGRGGGAELRHGVQPAQGTRVQVDLQFFPGRSCEAERAAGAESWGPPGSRIRPGHPQGQLQRARSAQHPDLCGQDQAGLRHHGVQGQELRRRDRGQALPLQDRARRFVRPRRCIPLKAEILLMLWPKEKVNLSRTLNKLLKIPDQITVTTFLFCNVSCPVLACVTCGGERRESLQNGL